jgi:hypothetical protein
MGEGRSDSRGELADSPRIDLLSGVREVCRLYWARRGHPDADVKESEATRDGHRLPFLRVSYVDDNFTEHALVGVHDGAIDAAIVRRFAALFDEHTDVRLVRDLVYRGEQPSGEVATLAPDRLIRLRPFDGYQRALWNHAGYLTVQTETLVRDGVYPLDKHVDKRWAPLGQPPGEATASRQILRWLDTDGPRFVLVLGDFGTGKTFLVRVLAQELAKRDDLVPVLVTMRDLEKGRTLDELLAQHMARYRPDDPFHARSFRYLLRAGRIALLFDGFDELAQRPTYDRVRQHFQTLRQAADGSAKIVVTSRHQHFATDTDVLNELGRDARGMAGAQIIRLFPLDDGQQRTLVGKSFDNDAARSFLRDLHSVPNLPELAANPRMLTFMMARRDSLARLARAGPDAEPMTAGRLYEVLLNDWLTHEVERQTAHGAAKPLTVPQRCAALRELAVRLWRTGRASMPLAELGELAEGITDLATWQVQAGEATHAVGAGTVLLRTAAERFAFIHPSVLEWFVADSAREALTESTHAADRFLADHALTPLMVDFLGDLAGKHTVVDWARAMVAQAAGPGPKAKPNAALILQHLDSRPADGRDEGRTGSAIYAGQDLRGLDLSRQDLTGADLSGAELDGAVLPKMLARANLRNARLVGAQLDGADLSGANLIGADLRGARLTGADLRGAQLAGARLDRAVLLGAQVEASALSSTTTFGAALPGDIPTPHVGSASAVNAVVVFGEGTLLATGHDDGLLRIWDAGSGRQVRTLTGHPGRVLALGVAPDGAWLASVGDDEVVRVWDPVTGIQQRSLAGHSGRVWALAVAPDGAWLASAGDDRVVRVWDPVTGVLVRTLEGHTDRVWALAVAPDGAWLASAGDDGTVRVWDPTTGAITAVAVGDENGWVIWHPDGGYQVAGTPADVWWVAGLCRFEPAELDEFAKYVPGLYRLPKDGPRAIST